MKDKVLETLKELGFQPEELEEGAYRFMYEGKSFLYLPMKDDDSFLSIAIIGLIDSEDENDLTFYQVMNMVNNTLKYVKVVRKCDSMHLFYERELIGNEDIKQVLTHMIISLDYAYEFLRSKMEEEDDDDDNPSNNDEE